MTAQQTSDLPQIVRTFYGDFVVCYCRQPAGYEHYAFIVCYRDSEPYEFGGLDFVTGATVEEGIAELLKRFPREYGA